MLGEFRWTLSVQCKVLYRGLCGCWLWYVAIRNPRSSIECVEIALNRSIQFPHTWMARVRVEAIEREYPGGFPLSCGWFFDGGLPCNSEEVRPRSKFLHRPFLPGGFRYLNMFQTCSTKFYSGWWSKWLQIFFLEMFRNNASLLKPQDGCIFWLKGMCSHLRLLDFMSWICKIHWNP